MGYPMARNLAKSRHAHPQGSPPLLVYNRTKSKSEALLKELGSDKVRVADSPEQLAKECDIIITNLANDDAVKAIYQQFSKALEVCMHTRSHAP
jgi:3-hydroxyisobutyrate dehydrogenase-like beta-hydroxyacid dehydrogenase